MIIPPLHFWTLTPTEAIALQRELANQRGDIHRLRLSAKEASCER